MYAYKSDIRYFHRRMFNGQQIRIHDSMYLLCDIAKLASYLAIRDCSHVRTINLYIVYRMCICVS